MPSLCRPFLLCCCILGKPFLETLSCIPSGFIFGYLAYRTRSFLPCFIIHLGIYVMMIVFTNC
ncbi:type II CAAX prenyl endopeptidase Rce1 family protein [Chloroflexota bacterium]